MASQLYGRSLSHSALLRTKPFLIDSVMGLVIVPCQKAEIL